MSIIPYPAAVELSASACAGIALGVLITTRTELRKQGFDVDMKVDPFERIPFVDGVKWVLTSSIHMVLACCITFGVGYLVLRLGGIRHLSQNLQRADGIAWITGVFAGKLARYLYWRSQ